MKVDQFKILEKLGWKFVAYSKGRITSYEFRQEDCEIDLSVNINEDKSVDITYSNNEYMSMTLIKELASIDWSVL